MNQRISVRAIIKDGDKTLLLRRAEGRQSILGKYELPGSRITYGEQPEDALRRSLYEGAGIHIQTVQLFDAITYIDHDDRDIQYLVVTYMVGLADTGKPIRLGSHYDKYAWKKLSEVQHEEVTDLTQLLLGIIHQEQILEVADTIVVQKDVKETTERCIIYSDGGSRGNPGPSAAGYVILSPKDETIASGGQYLGITSNNQAEYNGVYLALKKAHELGLHTIDFRSDSMMVVNQLNGVYKIKNRDLWPIYEEIIALVAQFKKVSFMHVRREFNQVADGIVNEILDKEISA